MTALMLYASMIPFASGREHHAERLHRGAMFRAGQQSELRGIRQAERAQQRAVGRAAQQRQMAPRLPDREIAPIQAPPQEYRPPDPAPADRSARPGRLTPDERRALRQQINEAGRDVYRPGRP